MTGRPSLACFLSASCPLLVRLLPVSCQFLVCLLQTLINPSPNLSKPSQAFADSRSSVLSLVLIPVLCLLLCLVLSVVFILVLTWFDVWFLPSFQCGFLPGFMSGFLSGFLSGLMRGGLVWRWKKWRNEGDLWIDWLKKYDYICRLDYFIVEHYSDN